MSWWEHVHIGMEDRLRWDVAGLHINLMSKTVPQYSTHTFPILTRKTECQKKNRGKYQRSETKRYRMEGK